MKILASTHSNLPRIGDNPEEQKLRRAYAQLEKQKISEAEFLEIQNDLIKELISTQESSGCGIVTDGMIRWYDHLSHVAGNLSGFEINGLLRFFDTNYYFRQPIAGDDIGNGNGALSADALYLKENSVKANKAVITGPYTLARLSQNKSAMNFDQLCLKLADIIGLEIAKIAETGVEYIQIEEPSFVRDASKFDLFKECVTKAASGKGKAKLILAFYFGDCTPHLEKFSELDVDMLGLDFSYSPGLLKKLSGGFSRPLSFGILDGRNTRIEDPQKVADGLAGILKNSKFDECHITTSCGLEFLPRQYAIKKLELTGRVAELLTGMI